jgi:hypothetical protein
VPGDAERQGKVADEVAHREGGDEDRGDDEVLDDEAAGAAGEGHNGGDGGQLAAVGGPATTTYSENIGVMAATRVYSTAAYWAAAFFALLFGLCPKFGAIVAAVPGAVLGGITVILYGVIGLLGAQIWSKTASTSATR